MDKQAPGDQEKTFAMDKQAIVQELAALRPILHRLNAASTSGGLGAEDDPDVAATREWHQAVLDRVVWLQAKLDELANHENPLGSTVHVILGGRSVPVQALLDGPPADVTSEDRADWHNARFVGLANRKTALPLGVVLSVLREEPGTHAGQTLVEIVRKSRLSAELVKQTLDKLEIQGHIYWGRNGVGQPLRAYLTPQGRKQG